MEHAMQHDPYWVGKKNGSCNCTTTPAANPIPGLATMYSAGFNSMYSLLRHQDSTIHLVRLFGYDFFDTKKDIQEIMECDQGYATDLGKRYIPVETNFREYVLSQKISFSAAYAFGLYAATLALRFKHNIDPSSHTSGELFPESSHPLTDPVMNASMRTRKCDSLTLL